MTEQDPERLSSAGAPLLRLLIDEGRKEVANPAQLASLAARLGPVLGGGGPGGGGAHGGGGSGVAAKLGGAGLAKGLGIAAVGAAAALTLYRVVAASDTATPSPAPQAESPAPAATSRQEPAQDPLEPSAEPPNEPPPAPSEPQTPLAWPSVTFHHEAGAPPPNAPRTMTPQVKEMLLLSQAQASLQGDPAKALRLCNEAAQRFPNGDFGQERDLLTIEALMRLGRGDEAKRRADAFKVKYRDSPLSRRIDDLMTVP